MRNIAIKMLFGDRAKYLGLVFGVAFATLLMAQQVSLFIGVIARTGATIYDMPEVDIWVMDPRVRYIEEIEPLRQIEVVRVKSVPGIEWAVPFYKGMATIRMQDGLTQQVQLIGIDDISLIGGCPKILLGDPESIRYPGSVIMDRNGYIYTWPTGGIILGRELELNDRRLKITALCDARATFQTFPIMYVTYDTAMEVIQPQRKKMSFVLVKAKPGGDKLELAKLIEQQTGLRALTSEQFVWRSVDHVLKRTGIPINFGITIGLGIIIGAAITAQTFYIFIIENLKQFAAMKAIGVTNKQLLKLVLTQSGIVASIGYGIGIGLTELFFYTTTNVPALKGLFLPWQVMVGSAAIVAMITLFSISFSLRRVFKLDPAIVF